MQRDLLHNFEIYNEAANFTGKSAANDVAEAVKNSVLGFQLAVEKIHNGFSVFAGLSLRNKLTYTTDMDITGDIGNVTHLENLFNKGLDKKLTEIEDELARTKIDLQEGQAAKGKPRYHTMSDRNGSTLSIFFRIDKDVVEHNREFITKIICLRNERPLDFSPTK